jgi:rhodanese-related sulfurtransferase
MKKNRSTFSLLALVCLTLVAVVAFAWRTFAEPPATADQAEKDRSFRKRVDGINQSTGARLISAADLQEKLKKGERVVLLDVREPKENEVSALPGARLAVPGQIETMPLGGIPANATVVTYCTVGGRSGKAAVLLEKRLSRPVYNLDGGIIEWFNSGGQVIDPSGKPVDRIDAWGEPWSSFVHPR